MAKELVWADIPQITEVADAFRAFLSTSEEYSFQEMKGILQSIPKKTATTVNPTKSVQTVVPSGTYTTGDIKVNAIPSEYIVPTGSETKTENGTYDVTSLAQIVVDVAGSGGLPSGIKAIDFGNVVVSSAFTTTRQTFSHKLGVTPDFVMVYATSNVATTYSMLWAIRCPLLAYRSSAYDNYMCYHGNSTTTVTITNSNSTTYGVSNMTATTFQLASASTSYYWRAGTYKYIALKFS